VPVVVCGVGGEGGPFDLPASLPGDYPLGGGGRSLHELAVAIAATGRDVELRGRVSRPELARLADAAGAAPRVDLPVRRPGAGEVVIVPEGYQHAVQYARLSLSPARRILLLLGPPGLTGWPFTADWSGKPDPLTVALDAVARPEHFRAMDQAGFDLWTHSPGMAQAVEESGVACTLIGTGTPLPFPVPGNRPHDVVWVQANRWAPLARSVVERLEATTLGVPEVPHTRMLELLGTGRTLVWPSRIEGQSRIQIEARAAGTVPVALDSNRFAAGLDEAGGAVLVGSLEEMVEEIHRLLADPGRSGELSTRARRAALAQVDWESYVGRVDRALDTVPSRDPAGETRALLAAALDLAVDRAEATPPAGTVGRG
jgi:hypothetical protein